MNRLLFALVVLVLGISGDAHGTPAAGTRGMVTSAHPAATDAGVRMLRAGGNAIDAAVASAFALAVAEPYSSGLGGGGFALVSYDGAVHFLDFREVAPARATEDMYLEAGEPKPGKSRDGILAAGVPGAVRGYLDLHERFGELPREQVLAPAIAIAREGFIVDTTYREIAQWRRDVLRLDGEAARIFLVPDPEGGAPLVPPLGHKIVQEDLAKTLEAIARGGADVFYSGEVSKALIADIESRGGLITAADLRTYKTRERKPLAGSFRGRAVVSAPLPSSGGQIVLTLLNVLETLPAIRPWRGVEELHLYIEASKRAFADRVLLGDPNFVPDLTPNLVAKDRAELLAVVMQNTVARADDVPPGQGAQLPPGTLDRLSVAPFESRNTTHLNTIDSAGNAVAMTTTINYSFGSAVVAKGTGMLWNDEMDDFAIAPGVPNAYGVAGSRANAVHPGKVPLSSMSPTFVFDGPTSASPLRMVLGSPGGPRIPTTVVQTIVNHLDHGQNIEGAITTGRLHHQHLPDHISIEPHAIDAATQRKLEAMGHIFQDLNERGTWSNASAIVVDFSNGVRTGSADRRAAGTAAAE